MAEIEHIVTEYTAKLGDAGTATIRYSGPPLSQLPENQGSTANMVKRMAELLQEKVATSPALAEVARRGWSTNYDVD